MDDLLVKLYLIGSLSLRRAQCQPAEERRSRRSVIRWHLATESGILEPNLRLSLTGNRKADQTRHDRMQR